MSNIPAVLHAVEADALHGMQYRKDIGHRALREAGGNAALKK